MNQRTLYKNDFDSLLKTLKLEGYHIIAPQVADNAIVYRELLNFSQLPLGVSDIQGRGKYALEVCGHNNWFAWANGPQALKPLLFSANEPLWSATQGEDKTIHFEQKLPEVKPTAVLGVRACDLAALALHDKHFLEREYVDPYYQQRRNSLLLIAVNCSHPSANCFCVSTGDGPFVQQAYDILLTELDDRFLISSGSEEGEKICRQLTLDDATETDLQREEDQQKTAIAVQKKSLPNVNIADSLQKKLNHPQWEVIAEKCLSCGNCTAVCPSCFCHKEIDQQSLDGENSLHSRHWDSCFSQEHGHIHGAHIREETSKQYRQWLTHKFSAWVEQYGKSGCVGCGRCISWCPAGIDVTEELSVLCDE